MIAVFTRCTSIFVACGALRIIRCARSTGNWIATGIIAALAGFAVFCGGVFIPCCGHKPQSARAHIVRRRRSRAVVGTVYACTWASTGTGSTATNQVLQPNWASTATNQVLACAATQGTLSTIPIRAVAVIRACARVAVIGTIPIRAITIEWTGACVATTGTGSNASVVATNAELSRLTASARAWASTFHFCAQKGIYKCATNVVPFPILFSR